VAWDVGGALPGVITYPFFFATTSNGWEHMLWPSLPAWLTIRDRDLIGGFYSGNTSAYQWLIIKAWMGPALWWASFVGVVMWVCLCLNSIVRKRWADEEKLAFPLVTLPIQLVDQQYGLLRNRLFWTAVAITFGIETLNLISSLAPSIPGIPFQFRFFQYVAGKRPWNMMPFPLITLSPWLFGVIYLIPLDLVFSMFVFDVLWNIEFILCGVFGWSQGPQEGMPYAWHQCAGGFLAIVIGFLWLDRRYFLEVLKKALGARSSVKSDKEEAFSYRTAVIGAFIGLGYLFWFLSRTGMQPWVVGAFLLLYFMLMLAISRLRAQLGAPAHTLENMMPNNILHTLIGPRVLGPQTLGMFYLLGPYLQQQDNNPTPIQLEALKMAENGRMQRHRLALAMAAAAPLSIIFFLWANMHIGFQTGMATGDAHEELLMSANALVTNLDSGLRFNTARNDSASLAMGVGFIATLVLMTLKLRFIWWPLHPVVFPMAVGWMTMEMMVPLFAVWLFKILLLRYGGLKSHQRALPFFLGLLVGGLTSSGLNSIILRLVFR
jgi:hypothetical protein